MSHLSHCRRVLYGRKFFMHSAPVPRVPTLLHVSLYNVSSQSHPIHLHYTSFYCKLRLIHPIHDPVCQHIHHGFRIAEYDDSFPIVGWSIEVERFKYFEKCEQFCALVCLIMPWEEGGDIPWIIEREKNADSCLCTIHSRRAVRIDCFCIGKNVVFLCGLRRRQSLHFFILRVMVLGEIFDFGVLIAW